MIKTTKRKKIAIMILTIILMTTALMPAFIQQNAIGSILGENNNPFIITAEAASIQSRRIAENWDYAKFADGKKHDPNKSYSLSLGLSGSTSGASINGSVVYSGNYALGAYIPVGMYVNYFAGVRGEKVWAREIGRYLEVGQNWNSRTGQYQNVLIGWKGQYFYINRSQLGY